MTSTRIEASIQARQAEFRTAVKCLCCKRTLSIAEQIEKFCTRCAGDQSISSNQEGRT